MFESFAGAEWDPEGLRAARCRLTALLDADSGLEDSERLQVIRLLEELACTIAAAQAKLSVELDASQRRTQAGAGIPMAGQGRGVASQVAIARRVSPHRGQRLLGLAKLVSAELPHTWAAWRQGRITEWKVTLLARETACLTLADRREIDARIAGDPDRLEAMGPRELAAETASLAAQLDPAAAVARRRKAESERHVSLRPAPDTMTWFTALLPVKAGVALYAAVKQAADFATGLGDPRGRGQIMADTLVSRVTGQPAEAVGVTLNLTMPATSLFGPGEHPGHLDGFGPIPAELARELVAGTLKARDHLDIRRLFTSPNTGQLQAMEARTRRFRGNLARFIRLRDQTCRTPWCEAPIRHLDHAEDHAEGGRTDALNGQGLCETCNQAKTMPGWRARPGPDGSITTTSPDGQSWRTVAPALARIGRTPIRIDYVLSA